MEGHPSLERGFSSAGTNQAALGRTEHGISAKITTKTERSKPEFGKAQQTRPTATTLPLLPTPATPRLDSQSFQEPQSLPHARKLQREAKQSSTCRDRPVAAFACQRKPPKIPKLPLTWGRRAAPRAPWRWTRTGRRAAASRRQLQNKKENPQFLCPTNPPGFLRDPPLSEYPQARPGAHPAPGASSPGIPARGTAPDSGRIKIQLENTRGIGAAKSEGIAFQNPSGSSGPRHQRQTSLLKVLSN